MKESYYYWKKILTNFFNDVLKRALLLYIVGFLIVFAIGSWRANPLAYIISFLVCFGISFFLFMRKGEIKDEFKPDQ